MNYEFRGKNYTADKKYVKIFRAFFNMKDATDIKKNKLHLASYKSIPFILHNLAQNGFANTCLEEVKSWFAKQGCSVITSDQVNYKIIL